VKPDERLFEDAITAHLVNHGGYQLCKHGLHAEGVPDFDPVVGLDTAELFAFIGSTQGKEWSELTARYGKDAGKAQKGFVKRLAQELDARGTVDVLRHGVVDLGVTIRLAFFKPAHSLTPDLVARYEANRLTVTRQLPFEPDGTKTLDLCLFVNGLPVVTAELKNPLTGQGVEEAKVQYRRDRDPRNVTLGRRAVVHFAVDPDSVAMTTRLAGEDTVFLPFNRGHERGPGNPPNPHGHRTSYLWERVWQRDAWLDLLARFVHVQMPASGSAAFRRANEMVIFPRYHQWDAVLALEADARARGAGQNYLVQHSAGSGKSNTIAWTAHRLSSLHDEADRKVFDKVIVITDRVVLDRQLQDTIYQFEHARGVVERIDKSSQQLSDALAGEQARIVITTLQKFPFVLDKVGQLPSRRYAVIVDEAHSSQTGEAAKDLRMVLGETEEQELTAAEAEDAGFIAEAVDPVEEALAKAVAARGRQPNLSFFAFTGTPKARTLELFGTPDPDPETRQRQAFHLYSMRQAIGEGFIIDVLANYTTYQTFWRIEKTLQDDPALEEARAKRAIARFVQLHPYQLAQKAEIVVEHFRRHVRHRIGGKAKAMVVTSSRLHAVRYKDAIDRYIAEHGYSYLAALVAFSGKVVAGGEAFTESQMNSRHGQYIPESRTAEAFAGDDYQVLIVAEKFQTGFDQPLLHTMYVDKVLTGLAAVQTLSRLNRIHPLKSETFVLDFRNEAEAIQEAFEAWYGQTVAVPSDPNLLFDTRRRLDEFDVLRPEEIEEVVGLLLTLSAAEQHGLVYGKLAPAVERFGELGEEDRFAFKDALDKYVRTYSFLSQVVSFGDTKLERDYRYCRALAACLRGAGTASVMDLGSSLELTHLRNEITFEGTLRPEDSSIVLKGFTGDGIGGPRDEDLVPLSEIVEVLNERFGADLTDRDQLLFDQFFAEWTANEELRTQALSNTIDNFKLVFDRLFLDTVVKRMDANEEIFKRVLDDQEFQQTIADFYLRRVYARLREATAPGAEGDAER
jgi:type I restriction enzyme R subunit